MAKSSWSRRGSRKKRAAAAAAAEAGVVVRSWGGECVPPVMRYRKPPFCQPAGEVYVPRTRGRVHTDALGNPE